MLRVRLTRYQCIVIATLFGSALIAWLSSGSHRILGLGSLWFAAGLLVGLGVSFPQWQLFGPTLCHLPTGRKEVALTFDDGPDPATTPALLELLARRGIKATFFCVGERVARYPELAARINAAGHAVENHTHGHSYRFNLFSVKRVRADLSAAQQTLKRATGRAPRYFRPPMGLTNQRVVRVARELGLILTGYTARGLDRRPGDIQPVLNRLLRGVKPGAILLLHDGGVSVDRLLQVVAKLLDELDRLGYRCVRLDELGHELHCRAVGANRNSKD